MKICIIGPSGAGKSTILKKLADEFNVPVYEFDEIYWDLSGTHFVKNSEEFMDMHINKIINKIDWIVEGAYDKRMYQLLTECSLILKIEVPYWLRVIRLFKRFLVSKMMGKQPRETLWNTLHLILFSYKYDKRLDKFLYKNTIFSSKIVIASNVLSCINAIRKMNTR
ncbi:AAA family ATPase [Xenorhabdus thailandensis]|uniref:AAA family ATPase n=1 Tax=Xenorhabdus thailandensis TaxID=3136255 RepID=UPI0030F45177